MRFRVEQDTTGILTLSSAENYGAVLQCYSLCEKLNEMGHPALIIDYFPDFIIGRYKWFFLRETRSPLDLVRDMAHFPDTLRKKAKFLSFRKRYLRLTATKYVRTFEDYSFYRIIVGSDQVWNTALTRNEKDFFLLSGFDGKQRNSYAASLGKDEIMPDEASLFIGLKEFNRISVRERRSVEELKKLLGDKPISRNVDPVFLHNQDFWEKLCKANRRTKEYILIYDFVTTDKAVQLAKIIKEKHQYEIVHISQQFRSEYSDVTTARGIGPRDFLTLVKHASYVITDSFHGMAFSIIFNRQFNVIPYPGTASRMLDLLGILGMSDRIADGDTFSMEEIDYEDVNNRIRNEQEASEDYLESIYRNPAAGEKQS